MAFYNEINKKFNLILVVSSLISRSFNEVVGKQITLSNSLYMQAFKRDSSDLPTGTTDQKLHSDFVHDLTSEFQEQETKYIDLVNPLNPYSPHPHVQNDLAGINDLPMPLLNTELKPGSESSLAVDRKSIYSFAAKPHLLDSSFAEEGLKKLDSFNRWMSKELGDVNDLGDANELHMQSSSGAYWDSVDSETGVHDSISSGRHLDVYMMSPSLAQDQLFSIIDFSPNWTYVGIEVKVCDNFIYLN